MSRDIPIIFSAAMIRANPLLALTSVQELTLLDSASREAVRRILIELSIDARQRAQTSWRRNKGPMAAYWKAVSVYARHSARAIGMTNIKCSAIATAPERIQRKRTKGWRMPPNTVSVTRPGKWGNPYYPGCGLGYGGFDEKGGLQCADVSDPRVQVKWFTWKMEEMQQHFPDEFEAYIAPLRGKNLACFCSLGEPCHADVLLKLANPAPEARAA